MKDEKNMLKFQIKKLKADNYFAWSNDMEVILKGKGLWKYVVNAATTDNASKDTQGVERATDAEASTKMKTAVFSDRKTQKKDLA